MVTVAVQALAVSAQLSGTAVLHSVSASFAVGQWTSVVGPNGAGKSTLLKVLAGLLPYEGQVHLLGQDLDHFKPRLRAQSLAWLGQGHDHSEGGGGADDLSVYDVAMLGRLPHQGWLAAPSSADYVAVEQALRTVQAWDWRARALGQLSGGERQRVLLARVLAVQARVLLMDEPVANLDPPHQSDWLGTVRTLVASGTTVISVLHEVSLALQADSMLIMAGGRVLHHGACSESATHRALESVFDHRLQVHAVGAMQVALPYLKNQG